jgi:hypothetical protein
MCLNCNPNGGFRGLDCYEIGSPYQTDGQLPYGSGRKCLRCGEILGGFNPTHLCSAASWCGDMPWFKG